MKKWFSELKLFFLNRRNMYWNIFLILLACFGFVSSLFVSLTSNYLFLLLYLSPLVLTFVIFLSHYFYLFKFKGKMEILKGKNGFSLNILYGDLLELDSKINYKIISIDEDMNWEVNEKIVSKNTLHGKILTKLREEENIDLKEYFFSISSEEIKKVKKLNNEQNLIDEPRKIIFIPLTAFDENNQAYTSYEKYISVLINLLKRIDSISSNSDSIFNMPIFGTSDKSRNLIITNEEALKLMKSMMLVYPWNSKNIKVNVIIYKGK